VTSLGEPGPLFSVITVCRNSLADLRITASSVLEQEDASYEYVIIDAQSSDGTVPFLRDQTALSDRLTFVSEPDDGIYDAMNKARSLSRGRYVIYMNAGDTFRDSRVLQRWEDYVQQSRPAWFYSRALVVDAARKPVRPSYGLRRYSTFKHAYARAAICHQAVSMSRSLLFDRIGGFDDADGLVADYALLLRAGRLEEPGVIDRTDVEYLDGGLSAVNPHTQREKHLARVRVFAMGPARRVLDFGFSRAQDIEIRARRRIKSFVRRSPFSGLIHSRASRRA
jgi:glycosyltransferase involved in cell wall biosynthesis